MQKKLIAAAIVGLFAVPAMAQSNVTISGQMRVGIDNVSAGGATAAGISLQNRTRVVDNNSNIRFAGTEALGGGLTAWWQVETAIGTSDNIGTTGGAGGILGGNNATIGTRNTAVGIKGAWGNVYLGKWDMHYHTLVGVDGTGLTGGLGMAASSLNILHSRNGANGAGGRMNNAIMYDTPTWNGFNVRFGYSTTGGAAGVGNEVTATNARKESTLWVNPQYNNGPWTAFYSYLRRNDIGNTIAPAASPDGTWHRAGLAYTFAMGLKLGVLWDRNSGNAGAGAATLKRTAWAIPVQYTMGPHTFNATYARAGDVSNTPGVQTGAKQWMLGYTYALSKRTMVGAHYAKINNEAGGNYDFWHPTQSVGASTAAGSLLVGGAAGADPRMFGLNLHHSF